MSSALKTIIISCLSAFETCKIRTQVDAEKDEDTGLKIFTSSGKNKHNG